MAAGFVRRPDVREILQLLILRGSTDSCQLLKRETFRAEMAFMPNGEQRVLVVDDDPIFAEFMAKTVEASGYVPVVAHDGMEGLRLARSLFPALILCDLSMPGLGGVEILRMLRDDPVTASIGRILVSGHVCPHLHGIAADTFIAKPVAAHTLQRLLSSLLEPNPGIDGAQRESGRRRENSETW